MKATPGVSWHAASGKWCAYVNHAGARNNLGLFSVQAEAEAAVLSFKKARDIEIDERAPIESRVIYADGRLVWRQHGRGHEQGGVVGSIDKASGYAFTRLQGGEKVYIHRLVWQLLRGPIPAGMEIDHINGQRADNRIENLRAVTRSINLKNKRATPLNVTGHRGVTQLPDGRFLARVWSDGRAVRVGIFPTPEQAGAARRSAEAAHGYHPNHGKDAA